MGLGNPRLCGAQVTVKDGLSVEEGLGSAGFVFFKGGKVVERRRGADRGREHVHDGREGPKWIRGGRDGCELKVYEGI